jgi:hypothetical protein
LSKLRADPTTTTVGLLSTVHIPDASAAACPEHRRGNLVSESDLQGVGVARAMASIATLICVLGSLNIGPDPFARRIGVAKGYIDAVFCREQD